MGLLQQIEFPVFFIALIANVAIALIVLRYGPKSASRYIFLFFIVSQLLWITANFVTFSVPKEYFLLLARFTICSATFHAFSFFLFIYTFLEERNILTKKLLIPLGTALVIVAGLTMSPYVFPGLTLGSDGVIRPEIGPAMPFFGLFVGLCVIWAFSTLIKRYRASSGMERLQWRYLAFGLSLTFALVLGFSFFNFVFLGHLDTVQFGHLYTLPFIIFTAYAMVKHQLFNVKAIVAELAVILLNLVMFIQLVTADSPERALVTLLTFGGTLITGGLLVRGVIQEIKHREELEKLTKELETANAKLEELSHFKTQLLSLASHQIRSPLAAMKGFIQLLVDGSYGKIDNPKIIETLGKVKASADQLIDLINTLLDLRKVEEGKMDYQFAETDMRDLVTGVYESLKPLANTKGLEFVLHVPKDRLLVSADAQKLRQVIQNVVDNAIKYTPTGSVTVELYEADHAAMFAVRDTGLGFAPEMASHLFEEFVRDERVKKQILGTGLGLYIARKIIEAHGGRIWAESRGPQKGSAFFVTLKKTL